MARAQITTHEPIGINVHKSNDSIEFEKKLDPYNNVHTFVKFTIGFAVAVLATTVIVPKSTLYIFELFAAYRKFQSRNDTCIHVPIHETVLSTCVIDTGFITAIFQLVLIAIISEP